MNNKQLIWEQDEYYKISKKASEDSQNHPGLQKIKILAQNCHKILEVGCGEGTKLNYISSKNINLYGIDISNTAINLAKKQFPSIKFSVSDAEQINYANDFFDLTYSAFVLEHTQNPDKIIKEMIRITKINGYLALIMPNYGAPNRRSPCSKQNKITKLFKSFLIDLFNHSSNSNLNWQKVIPISDDTNFQIDWDTTIEPYHLSLHNFLKSQNLKIIESDSCWQIEEPNENILNKIFRFMGKLKLYPFRYWGPHILIITKKS